MNVKKGKWVVNKMKYLPYKLKNLKNQSKYFNDLKNNVKTQQNQQQIYQKYSEMSPKKYDKSKNQLATNLCIIV